MSGDHGWVKTKYNKGHIAAIQGGKCIRCGGHLNLSKKRKENDRDGPSIDHVIPRCHGGQDQIGNVVVLHRKCNDAKASRRATGCEVIWAAVIAAHPSYDGLMTTTFLYRL